MEWIPKKSERDGSFKDVEGQRRDDKRFKFSHWLSLGKKKEKNEKNEGVDHTNSG